MIARPSTGRSRVGLTSTALVGAAFLGATGAGGLEAQSDVTLEVGASRIGTTLDAAGSDPARFVMAGLRASHYGTSGTGIFGSALFGQDVDARSAGSFVSGILEGRVVGEWSPGLEVGMEARLLGFSVENPFPYRSFAAEGGPSVQLRRSDVSLRVSAVAGLGESQVTLWRVDGGERRTFTNELWRGGGTAELLLGPATSRFGLTSGWHRTPSGDYESVGARAIFASGWGIVEFRADRWVTPFDTEIVAGLAFMIPLGSAWSVRAFVGRTDPDPLTLAQPGSTSGGALLGWSLLPSETSTSSGDATYAVTGAGPTSSRVRFLVEAPRGATTVQLLGDFSLWEPIAMERDGDRWRVEIDVPVGTHHFGFLVDDEWYLPADAPDVVPDEWGRESATLVIEGAS